VFNKNILHVASIVDNTIVDGEGFRTSLYLSGCDIFCEDCHNKELWDINSGNEFTVDEVYDKITNFFTDITFIGGEPMMQSEALTILARKIKIIPIKQPGFTVGHTYEEIVSQ